MAISHLQLVFKEKAAGEKNHQLNGLRAAPVWAGRKFPSLCESSLGWWLPPPPLVLSPLDSVCMAARALFPTGRTQKYQSVAVLGYLPAFLLCTQMGMDSHNFNSRRERSLWRMVTFHNP